MAKKQLAILSTTTAAAVAGTGFAQSGMWIPSLICLGWTTFVLWANARKKKKPRAASRGSEKRHNTKILDFYSTEVTIKTQAKVWTPAGKAVIPVNYVE